MFAVTLSMLLLVAVGGRFVGYLQEAALGKFTGATVLTIMYLRLPEFIQQVAPFALYVAIVLTLGRLYADQEMVVLQGGGASTQRLLRWMSMVLVTISLGVGVFSWYLTPQANRSLELFMAQLKSQTQFQTVNPGIFHIYDRAQRVTYSERMSDDRRILHDVFIAQQFQDGRQISIWAEEGRQEVDPQSGAHFLVLDRGHRYEGTPGEADFRVIRFDQLRQRLAQEPVDEEDLDVAALPLAELPDDAAGDAEWHWRLALPLFCLIGGLLAVGISRVQPRQGRFAKIVPGMLLMLLYYLGLLLLHTALIDGHLPGTVGLWPIHLVFLSLALYQLHKLGRPVAV